MTETLDVDGILKAMTNPEAGKNVATALEALKEVNKVLQEAQKTVDFLDRCGLKPLIVRSMGQKLGVDVDTPLAAEKSQFKPASGTHAQIFAQLNAMSASDVAAIFTPKVAESDEQT